MPSPKASAHGPPALGPVVTQAVYELRDALRRHCAADAAAKTPASPSVVRDASIRAGKTARELAAARAGLDSLLGED